MKNSLIFLGLIISSSISYAKCVDLSHKTKLGEADIEVRQVGCAKLSRQMYYKGEPIGDASVVNLDGKWEADTVDDQYESFARQVRWSWNSDESILIYEYVVDSTTKASNDKSVNVGTQVYKKTREGKVSFESYSQIRVMAANGAVTVDQDHSSELREPLP